MSERWRASRREPAKSAAFRDECSRLSGARGQDGPSRSAKTRRTRGRGRPDKPKANGPTRNRPTRSEDESATIWSRPPVQAIWLPKFYDGERKRMFAHIHDGEGEALDIKQRLQKGNTDTGNVRFAIVESEFKWTNQRFRGDADKKRYFCALLALTHGHGVRRSLDVRQRVLGRGR